MTEGNIEYKDDKISIRTALWIFITIVVFGFAGIYHFLYSSNSYHFYLPSQQEFNRLKIDSLDNLSEIKRLSVKLDECNLQLEQYEVEIKGISRIRNNISLRKNPKVNDQFYLREDTNFIATIVNLEDKCIQGDTIFKVSNRQKNKTYYCKLKLKVEEWAKVTQASETEFNSIKRKLDNYEDIVRDELDRLYEKQKILLKEISNIKNRIEIVNTSNVLNYFDFLVFSANIHISLGFNGLTPTSTVCRSICVLHKIIAIALYWLLFTKYKSKKKE